MHCAARRARRASSRRSTWPRCATRCSTWRCRSPTERSGPTPRSGTCRRRSLGCRSTGRDDFFLANMVPTVIDADVDAARAVHRRTLSGYLRPAQLPQLLEAGRLRGRDGGDRGGTRRRGQGTGCQSLMSDAWIDDCTISGSPGAVRDRIDEWLSMGVLPIVRDVVDHRVARPRRSASCSTSTPPGSSS